MGETTATYRTPAQQWDPGGYLGGGFPRRISTSPRTSARLLMSMLVPMPSALNTPPEFFLVGRKMLRWRKGSLPCWGAGRAPH